MGLTAMAQSSVKLFPEYTEGTILMKNRAIIRSMVNYDTTHDKLLYKDGNNIMELTNLADIDTIYVKKNKFVVIGQGFYDVRPLLQGNLFIKWHLREINIGQKGAYGQTTQNYVQTLNTSTYNNKGIVSYESADVNATNNYNQYSISVNGKLKRFSNKKGLLKIFSKQSTDIEKFMSDNRIDFQNVDDIVKLCNYCVISNKK
jgi:hypothetical protein